MLILLFVVCGCAAGITRIDYKQDESIKIEDVQKCSIAIKYKAFYKEEDVEILGMITSYDQGVSIDCSEIKVLYIFYKDGCYLGADLINVIEEKYPDQKSLCYRAIAQFVRFKDRKKVYELETDSRYSPNCLITRAKMANEQILKLIAIMGGTVVAK
jgi:hypothetical protein